MKASRTAGRYDHRHAYVPGADLPTPQKAVMMLLPMPYLTRQGWMSFLWNMTLTGQAT